MPTCNFFIGASFLVAGLITGPVRGAQPAPAEPRWRQDGIVAFVAYTADGKQVLTATYEGAIRKWDATTGQQVQELEKAINLARGGPDVRCRIAALSPDGKTLGVITYASVLRLFNVATGKLIREIATGPDQLAGAFAVAFAQDGETVFTARFQGRAVSQWDIGTGIEVNQFGNAMPKAPFPFGRSNLAVSAKVVASDMTETKNGQMTVLVKRWDLVKGKELPTVKAGGASVTFAPDGKLAALLDFKTGARLWDLDKDQLVRPLEGKGRPYVFSADGKRLAGRDTDRTLLVWDVSSGKVVHKFGTPPANSLRTRDNALAFSRDGTKLVAGADGRITQWDVRTGKEIAK